jgi:nucleoside-diphosphate-sugar epimerase
MRVLVTGATGFIGVPLLEKLNRKGHQVLALSRSAQTKRGNGIEWLSCDLASPESYTNKVKDFSPEVLIHLAWQDIPNFSLEKSRINLDQSLDFISFVIGLATCKKIIASGSCFELNQLQGECSEATQGEVRDHFTWAKHALYSWLRMMCKQKDIQLLWMRIFYVYGPRQRPESLIPSILTNLKQGKLPELRTPKNANDFIYVDDIADAFSKAVSVNNNSMIYNLGAGVSTSVLEVCRIAEKIVLGTETLTQKMDSRSKDTSCDVDFWADFTQSKKYLDWQPTTSLVDGIGKTWQWLNCK